MTKFHEVLITVVGFVFIGIGVYFLPTALTPPIDRKIVYAFVFLIALGGAFIFPTLMLSLAKTLADRLPTGLFGTRAGDVPLAQAPPGTVPGAKVTDEDKVK